MTVDRTGLVTPTTYAGAAKLHGKEANALGPVMVELLKDKGREMVKKANLADLVDNSGSVATPGLSIVGDATGGAFEDMFTIAQLAGTGGLRTGDGPFQFIAGTPATNTSLNTDYYVIRKTETVYQLATSRANAVAGTVIELGSDGSGLFLGAVGPFVIPPVFDSSSAGGVTVASANTAFDSVANAFAVMLERVNKVRAVLGMGSQSTGPGTIAASGTVAVIDDSATTTSGDTSSSQETVAKAIRDLSLIQKALILGISDVREAVGLGAVPVAAVRLDEEVLDAAIPPGGREFTLRGTSGTALFNAAAVSAGNAATEGVALAAVDAVNDVFADNVAFLVTLLDEVTATVEQQRETVIVPFTPTELTAGTNQTFAAPINGRIRRVFSMVTDAPSATGDNVTSLTINGTAVVGSGLTIASGSAIGVTDEVVISDVATNIVNEGDQVTIVSDGGSTAAGAIFFVEITPTDDTLTGTQTPLAANAGADPKAGHVFAPTP